MVVSPCRYTINDFKVLQEVLKEMMSVMDATVDMSCLRSVHSALEIIIQRKAINHARRYICIDDCDMIAPGHNGNLYDLPLSELHRHRHSSSYLGKAIIEWRLRLQK